MTDEADARHAGERVAFDHLVMIKAHILSLRTFIKRKGHPHFTPLSLVALRHAFGDIRMVIEELMLLSVSALKDAGEAVSRKLRNEYQAVNKMKLLRAINPRFFPEAIDVVPSDEPGISGQFVQVQDAYLTEEHVKFYYGKCGDCLHANGKATTRAGYDDDMAMVENFVALVSRLLQTFEVDISGQGYIMIGHIQLDDPGLPQLFFARNDPVPAVIDTQAARPSAS